LRPAALAQEVEREKKRLGDRGARLGVAIARRVVDARNHLDAAGKLLTSLSYEGVLERGFALVHKSAGGLARRRVQLASGEGVSLQFHDGRVEAVVEPAVKPAPRSRRGKVQGELF
jgi:exodeoxyribonuclease VII large subunit